MTVTSLDLRCLALAIPLTFTASACFSQSLGFTNQRSPNNKEAVALRAGDPGLIKIPLASYIPASATGKAQYISVSGAAFFPEASQLYSRNLAGGNVFVPNGVAGKEAHLIAPVQLPDGVIITGVTFYVLDNDPMRDLPPAQLWRQNSGPAGTSLVTVTGSTSGASTTVQVLSQTHLMDAHIDNEDNSYFLRFSTWQNNERCYLARVLITFVDKAE